MADCREDGRFVPGMAIIGGAVCNGAKVVVPVVAGTGIVCVLARAKLGCVNTFPCGALRRNKEGEEY